MHLPNICCPPGRKAPDFTPSNLLPILLLREIPTRAQTKCSVTECSFGHPMTPLQDSSRFPLHKRHCAILCLGLVLFDGQLLVVPETSSESRPIIKKRGS